LEQIIYGDVLFIINFSMDFLTIYLVSKIIHSNPSLSQLLLSSGIGALYGVMSLFQSGPVIVSIFVNISVTVIMAFTVFGIHSMIVLIRNSLLIYGVGFLIGGTMTALFTMVNNGISGRSIVIDNENRTLYNDIPFSLFIIIAILALVFSYLCGLLLKKRAARKEAELKISLCGKSTSLNALADSGNLLCEPLGGLPVAICAYDKLEPILPLGVRPLFRDSKIGLLEFTDPKFAKRVRMIPVSHIGGKGMLIGIIPDKAEINGESKQLCIACTSKTKSFGEKECIIPASIL